MSGQKIDVRALAQLARLEVPDAELEKLEQEIPGILQFVETIQRVPTSGGAPAAEHRNIMREDGQPHESGIYTEKLLAQAPAQKNNRVVVKQVISRNKK